MTERGAALLLVGCGKMGGALLAGWLERRMSRPIFVIEPSAEAVAPLRGRPGISIHADIDSLPAAFHPGVVVFAIKPQAMDAIVPKHRRFAGAETLILSIAAGRPISFFERHLGTATPVIRGMPNTPAQVGCGITVLCPNRAVRPAQRDVAQDLLAAVGGVAWIEDESLMDAVTAVSGSGPAYVFLLAECLAEAGIEAGLPPELANTLARATVAGAGELLRQSDEPAAKLRQNVTSPGGTTAAALDVLMAKDGLRPLLVKAVAAATKRSRELAG